MDMWPSNSPADKERGRSFDQKGNRNPAQPRHALKICAALVENPMNLGALCRTAEVFRLESLVLPDLAIAQTWEFRKLAASAHHWQPLEACSPAVVSQWIQSQQQLGYVVLALTTHPQACCLTEFTFPKKTALVLGRELTGIPDELIAMCGQGGAKATVDPGPAAGLGTVVKEQPVGTMAEDRPLGVLAIPQFGQVESLNVHTAAAIAIYEYVKQHAQPKIFD
ncbi:RNA methyltransferase [Pseudanabaena sp. FACHB-2040]|uniref:TrmH family RNA methyltransferase n=1 Tax=Pseudanabaena sp. FACHB-2040 TaxID=2692859 RepID=UPI001F55A9E0|nr:RNA methyltransferase [Pseudanabaena sp. FACHB-2040]